MILKNITDGYVAEKFSVEGRFLMANHRHGLLYCGFPLPSAEGWGRVHHPELMIKHHPLPRER